MTSIIWNIFVYIPYYTGHDWTNFAVKPFCEFCVVLRDQLFMNLFGTTYLTTPFLTKKLLKLQLVMLKVMLKICSTKMLPLFTLRGDFWTREALSFLCTKNWAEVFRDWSHAAVLLHFLKFLLFFFFNLKSTQKPETLHELQFLWVPQFQFRFAWDSCCCPKPSCRNYNVWKFWVTSWWKAN